MTKAEALSPTAPEPTEPDTWSGRRTHVEASPTFPAWLRTNSVSLAFTSYRSGQLLMVGVAPNGALSMERANFRRATGLCLHQDHLFVASPFQVWRLENALRPGATANEHYDRLFVPRIAQTTGDIDVREIAVDRSGRAIFVSTAYSCLAAASRRRSFAPVWKPPFVSSLVPEDRCHLNGLALEDGVPRYVTAMSRSDAAGGWREAPQSGGVIVDVQSDTVLTDKLSMPHSPRLQDGQLWALDSGRGCLVRVNRKTGRREEVAFCPGFPRGLAFVGRYAVVTVSLPRTAGAFDGLDLGLRLTASAAEPRCGILVIDTGSGEVVEWIGLHGAITELFDVVAIPGAVCPMVVGPHSQAMRSVVMFDPEFAPLAPQAAAPVQGS